MKGFYTFKKESSGEGKKLTVYLTTQGKEGFPKNKEILEILFDKAGERKVRIKEFEESAEKTLHHAMDVGLICKEAMEAGTMEELASRLRRATLVDTTPWGTEKVERSLWEYQQEYGQDCDVYDTEMEDQCVTVATLCEEEIQAEEAESDMRYMYLFQRELCKKVAVTGNADGYVLHAGWSVLIRNNWKLFRDFAEAYWMRTYKEEERFLSEWIKELHFYLAGYAPEDFYFILYNFVLGLRPDGKEEEAA